MDLIDLPMLLNHGFRWSLCRAFGRKWKQVEAVPQGINYGVGLVNLTAQRDEHRAYERDPGLKEKFVRARRIDDSLA